MLREAVAGDEGAIEAFLAGHAETSMFLRGNLHSLGLFDRETPHGTQFWLAERAGRVVAVFGLSNAGFVNLQTPDADAALLADFAARLAGRSVAGVTGEAAQVARTKTALGLDGAAFALDDPEPLYRLDLAAIDTAGLGYDANRPPTAADRDLLHDWFLAYEPELHMSPPARREAEAQRRTGRALTCDCVRLLINDGTPVAMTATDAALPDMVQVGGVYTPPAFRGRGFARTAVARHMEERRAGGVETAILFASGAAAARAYEAIGFQRVGTYSLALLAEPVVIGGAR